ncbi:cysteine hydrolase family protein [Petrachloros mirabilis]
MALVTIDTQCDTLDGQPLEIPGTSAILPNMERLLRAFREFERPIVHVVRIYRPDGSNVDLCRRDAVERGHAMLLADSHGSQLAAPLLPADIRLDSPLLLAGGIQRVSAREVVIYKPRWGAFYNTPLQDHLQALRVSTLVFTGCNFPNCPRTSIYEASERDYRIVLVTDAVSGLYERARAEMQNIGIALLTTDALLKHMKGAVYED